MAETRYLDALVAAMREEMARDPDIFVAGEDVHLGGPFGTEKGLFELYGARRVVNTPISESAIMGLGIGAAEVGLRPVIQMSLIDFMCVAMDQVVNQMAKIRYMFGGKATLPMTVRCMAGAGRNLAAQHSQSLEAWFCHVPGLKVVMPSNAYDAKGLLISAIRDDNPVIFIENKRLLGKRTFVPEAPYTVPLGKAAVAREGRDVSIVATGAMVREALDAALTLEERGIEAEVVDVRTLSPLDVETIVASVRKTGRAVVVQEAVNFCSMASEIAATIAYEAFDDLDAPVERLGAPFSPVPFSPVLERAWLVRAEQIVDRVTAILPQRA